MPEAAVGAVVVGLACLGNMAVEGQDCSIHLAQGNRGLVAAASAVVVVEEVVVVAVDEEGIPDVADTDGAAGHEGEVGE